MTTSLTLLTQAARSLTSADRRLGSAPEHGAHLALDAVSADVRSAQAAIASVLAQLTEPAPPPRSAVREALDEVWAMRPRAEVA